MDYQKLAEEFIDAMTASHPNHVPPPNINELSQGEVGILVYLVEGNKNNVSAGELSDALKLTTGRIATALKTLEKKKLVRRKSDPNDGRKVIVNITDDGKTFILNKRAEVIAHFTENLKKLTLEEAEQFVTLAKKFLLPSS
ncbi:MarR family winged helix-turn-helix transcriptional regulator [Paenibacillus sp. GCM10028914]|uniref:MarR family winged helix-turn-helix transcriptional regulator n=1 Tax=Paenibacillus sp. GCM10028914 TaxID=3273416 RepID=UPI003622886A